MYVYYTPYICIYMHTHIYLNIRTAVWFYTLIIVQLIFI